MLAVSQNWNFIIAVAVEFPNLKKINRTQNIFELKLSNKSTRKRESFAGMQLKIVAKDDEIQWQTTYNIHLLAKLNIHSVCVFSIKIDECRCVQFILPKPCDGIQK